MERHKIVKSGKCFAVLRIYLEGSGNPLEEHTIIALSIDGYGYGKIPEHIDLSEDLEDIEV